MELGHWFSLMMCLLIEYQQSYYHQPTWASLWLLGVTESSEREMMELMGHMRTHIRKYQTEQKTINRTRENGSVPEFPWTSTKCKINTWNQLQTIYPLHFSWILMNWNINSLKSWFGKKKYCSVTVWILHSTVSHVSTALDPHLKSLSFLDETTGLTGHPPTENILDVWMPYIFVK